MTTRKNTPNTDDNQRAEVVAGLKTLAANSSKPGTIAFLAMLAGASVAAGFLDRGMHARIRSEVMNEFPKPTDEAVRVFATRLADSVEKQEWLDVPFGEKLAMELRTGTQSAALDPLTSANETLDLVESTIREAVEDEGLSSYDELESILDNYSRDKDGLVAYLNRVADIISAAASKQPAVAA